MTIDTPSCCGKAGKTGGAIGSLEEISNTLTRQIQTRLLERGFNVTPLIDVNVLEAPTKT